MEIAYRADLIGLTDEENKLWSSKSWNVIQYASGKAVKHFLLQLTITMNTT